MCYKDERDKAFIAFVKDDDLKPWLKLCKKYGIQRPASPRIERAGIYKAVQYCTNIPKDIKGIAMSKCLEMGFSPFINTD